MAHSRGLLHRVCFSLRLLHRCRYPDLYFSLVPVSRIVHVDLVMRPAVALHCIPVIRDMLRF